MKISSNWVAHALPDFDAAVTAAYYWLTEISDDQLIERYGGCCRGRFILMSR